MQQPTIKEPAPMALAETFPRVSAPGTGRRMVQLTFGAAQCYPLYYFIPTITAGNRYLIHHRHTGHEVQLARLDLQTGETVQLTHASHPDADWHPWQEESGLTGVLDYRSALNVVRNQVVYFDGNTVHCVDIETLGDAVLFELPTGREAIGQNCVTPNGEWFVYIHAPAGSRFQVDREGVVAGYHFATGSHIELAVIDNAVIHVFPYDNEHFIVNHPYDHLGMLFVCLDGGPAREMRWGDPGVKGHVCHQTVTARGIAWESGAGSHEISGLYEPITRKRFEWRLPAYWNRVHIGKDPAGLLWFYEKQDGYLGHSLWFLEKLDREQGGQFVPLISDWTIADSGQRGHFHPQLTPDRRWILLTGANEEHRPQIFLLDVSDLPPTTGIDSAFLSETGENDLT